MGAGNLTRVGRQLQSRLSTVPKSAAYMGAAGALAGGAIAAVHNTYRVGKGEIRGTDAAGNVLKESVGTGVATAAGSAAMTIVGAGGFTGLICFMVVASLAKGAWDSVVLPKPGPFETIEETASSAS